MKIYKNNYVTRCTQKTAISTTTNMDKKNIFCSIVDGGTRNSKSNNSVSLTIYSCDFLMVCFKTVILKTYFAENKVKVHVFEVSVPR